MMVNKSFVFCFADVEVREREFSLLKAGKVLAVEPKAFRVLLHLLRSPQKLISKEAAPAARRRHQRAAFHRNRGHGRIPARVQG
jgi:DNA-binding response OmpR family regulator